MKQHPLTKQAPFSVLMSVYAGEWSEYLEAALDSVLDQTLQPAEIVIVKDGPLTAELERVLGEYQTQYPDFLIVVSLEENQGLGYALGVGLEVCSHDVVARMDTDDIAVSDRFEKQYQYLLTHQNVVVLGGQTREFEQSVSQVVSQSHLPLEYEDILQYAKRRCPLAHMTVMFRRDHVLSVGGYEEMHFFEDYWLWVRMLQKGYVFANLSDVVVLARIGEGMFRRRGGWQYVVREYRFFQKVLGLGFIGYGRFIANLFMRTGIRLMPNRLRRLVYLKLLRR